MPVTDFAFGATNPIISFLMALVGAVFGLICTARARRASTQHRLRWLLIAGVALGGVGIWLMHFMAMLGFDVPSAQIRYSVPLTALSLVISIVVVTGGLLFVGLGRPTIIKIVIGGVLTGLGVAGMHYTGMAALNLNGHVGYQPRLVVASVLIAIVASTVALWFTVVAKTRLAIGAASVIFALAVCSMHYTGMAAVHVTTSLTASQPTGVDPITLVIPIVLIVVVGLLAMLFVAMNMMASEPLDAAVEASGRISMSLPSDIRFGVPAPAQRPDRMSAREPYGGGIDGRHSDHGEHRRTYP